MKLIKIKSGHCADCSEINLSVMSFLSFQKISLFAVAAAWLCSFNSANAQWQKINALPSEPIYALYSENNHLYAATANLVYHSADGGDTWNPSVPIHQNQDEVTDLVMVNGNLYASMVVNGCYLSTDGGQSWQQHNEGLVGLGAKNLSALARRGDSLYAATWGSGVFVKPLSPVHTAWTGYNNNMPWGNVQSLTTDGNLLIAGAGGSATLARKINGSIAWSEQSFDVFNGEINMFLGAVRDSQVLLGGGTQGLYRSTDNGLSWSHFNPGVGLIERVSFARWQGTVVALLTKPNGSFLKFTDNQGLHWSPFQAALPPGGLGYELLSHQGKLFCAHSNGLWILSPNISTTEPDAAVFRMGQIFPNPVQSHQALIPFYVDQAAEGRLCLFDANGRLIQKLDLGILSVGDHIKQICLQGLADGVYICMLEMNGRQKAQRLLLQRSSGN